MFKRNQRTKLPNGKRPSYADLEQSFITVYEQSEVYKAEIRRLNRLVADLKHELKGK